MAGINAHLKISDNSPFMLQRSEAYIGVLIDDLVTKGTNEPYRMFTSRAEYRILLRQDNADLRLSVKGCELGLITSAQHEQVIKKEAQTQWLKKELKSIGITPQEINPHLEAMESSPITQQVKLSSVLTRPGVSMDILTNASTLLSNTLKNNEISEDVVVQAEIQVKYEGYIEREEEIAEKMHRLERVQIPTDINYAQLKSLSTEAVEKLSHIQPVTIGQATRISGVSPSDISVLLIYLGR
jgi:tRNA uridine 5-carboxymethylaminomethyl modification enzyme